MATEEERIDKLESEFMELKTRVTVCECNITEVKDKLNKIEQNTSKIIWLVISAIALALLDTVIKGGI